MDKLAKELISQYTPLALSIASSYTTLPFDDRRQEALLGLVIAATEYDILRRVPFGAFARKIIVNRLNRMYNITIKQPISVMIDIEDNDDDVPLTQVGFHESGYDLVEMFCLAKSLGDTYFWVVASIFFGLNQRECADKLGISQTTVNRMCKKIKEEILKGGLL